ncbi:MAG: beta,4-mannooligosaccharide phosphorylase [Chlamydiota bacterium]
MLKVANLSFFLVMGFLWKSAALFSKVASVFPVDFHGVPFADEQGIILSIKNVSIDSIDNPYNAALIQEKNGEYLLVFRYDKKEGGALKHNYMACVELDKQLKQKGSIKKLDTLSDFSNDPRVFRVGSQLFVVYNDIPNANAEGRIMKMAELHPSNFQLKGMTSLDRKIKKTEKNWVPFTYQQGGKEEVYFLYTINPYNVLKWDKQQGLQEVSWDLPCIDFPWVWGEPRGGTPAELVDGEYLTFFHSSFVDRNRKRWYVMGAFMFESKPPFRVTAVSPYPFLFKGIYSSPHAAGSSSRLRCIFPSGLVLEGKDKILVSCGENDAAVKIITFDKRALLNSLIKVSPCFFLQPSIYPFHLKGTHEPIQLNF